MFVTEVLGNGRLYSIYKKKYHLLKSGSVEDIVLLENDLNIDFCLFPNVKLLQ